MKVKDKPIKGSFLEHEGQRLNLLKGVFFVVFLQGKQTGIMRNKDF